MSGDSDLALRATLDYSGVSQGFDTIISKSGQLSAGISGQLSRNRGDFKALGANLGQDLIGGMGAQFGAAGSAATSLATALGPMGIAAGVAGAALIGVGSAAVQAAAAWETSMSGVAKTTGLGGAELEKLSSDLLTMSTNMPIAASELANIAQAGGSLGIAKDQLAGFTEVAAQMGIGFGMAADEAATAGAKILNAFGQPMNTQNLEKLGSVVNAMGDSFAATEPQVLDFLNRASFLNTTMGQSIQQVSALGTTLISAGMSSETAATGLKSFLNMATSTTSKKGGMENWAKLMGTSVDELKAKMGSDLNATLIDTANKIAAIQDPVERFQTAVALAGTEGAPAILKLAGQQENYRKALGMTNSEWEKANSLQKTYEAQAGTVNSQWQMFTNTLNMAATELGTVLLPYVASALGTLTDLAKIGIAAGEGIYDAFKPLGEFMGKFAGNLGEITGVNWAVGGAWSSLKSWAGIGEEAATEFQDGAQAATDNDPLGLNDPAVRKAAEEAGIDLGQLTGENAGPAAAEAFDEAFWSNVEQLQKQGIQSGEAQSLGQAIKDYYGAGGKGALITGTGKSDWKSGGWSASTSIDSLTLTSKWEPSSVGGTYSIYAERSDGSKELVGKTAVNSDFDMPSYQSMANEILSSRNIIATDQNLLELANKPIEATATVQVKVELENLWEAGDSQRSWMKFADENKELAKTAGDEIILALYNAELAAIKTNDPTLSESLSNVMAALAEPGSVPAEIFNQSLADIIDAGFVGAQWKDDLEKAASIATTGLIDSMTGTRYSVGEERSLADLLVPGGSAAIADWDQWSKNVFQPSLKSSFEEMHEIQDRGYKNDIAQTEEWIADKISRLDEYGDAFSEDQIELFSKWENHIITTKEFYDMWAEAVDDGAEKVKVTYSGSGLYYGDFASETDSWSDYALEGGGYIGPTEHYDEYMEQVEKQISGAEEAMRNIKKMDLEIDTSLAVADTQALIDEINVANPILEVMLDTSVADSQFQNLYRLITEANPVMSVQVEVSANAYQIRSIVQSAIADAIASA